MQLLRSGHELPLPRTPPAPPPGRGSVPVPHCPWEKSSARRRGYEPAETPSEPFLHPVANRCDLFALAQFAELRQPNEPVPRSTLPDSCTHRIRVHDAVPCLEHSLVLACQSFQNGNAGIGSCGTAASAVSPSAARWTVSSLVPRVRLKFPPESSCVLAPGHAQRQYLLSSSAIRREIVLGEHALPAL